MKTDAKKLAYWKSWTERNQNLFSAEVAAMDRRERQYAGDTKLLPLTEGELKDETPHVRNISAELIESQVNSEIPQPKVTPLRPEDEQKAKLIEDMLRNELDRLPMEEINDQMERTVPIQGGGLLLAEWDNSEVSHSTIGEVALTAIHPKQLVPQAGVYTSIEDMDAVVIKIPQTKGTIKRKYGVDVSDEAEGEPDIRGPGGESTADDMVTQYVAYYRNDDGGVGLYSWVNDIQLIDMQDYQARQVRRCATCGAAEPAGGERLTADSFGSGTAAPTMDGELGATTPPHGYYSPETTSGGWNAAAPLRKRGSLEVCPYCGGTKWETVNSDYEEIYLPVKRMDGSVIPGARTVDSGQMAGSGLGREAPMAATALEPTRVPWYKPNIFPVLLQKNVSVFGQLLGDSDLDKIRPQQNTSNRLSLKIVEKLVKSGSYGTIPEDARLAKDTRDAKLYRIKSPADKEMFGVFDLEGNVSQDMGYLAQVYEEARQIIGITDSFQGRKDPTATSGVAKQFAANQSAGRLESKRVMKDAFYAKLFEVVFKLKLAYVDEPRPVQSQDTHGRKVYGSFSRYDFLERDEAGEWYWNDRFLFSCDTSAPLAANREAMWQETRLNLQTGAFGNPQDPQTLILFWTKMEDLHYPGAGETRAYLEEQAQRQMMQQQMAQMTQAPPQAGVGQPGAGQPSSGPLPVDNERARATAPTGPMAPPPLPGGE